MEKLRAPLLPSIGLITLLAWAVWAGEAAPRQGPERPDFGAGSDSDGPAGSRVAPRLTVPPAEAGGVDAPLPRAISFSLDVPAPELRPADSMTPDPARDIGAVVVGKADGRVLVISREDLTAQSMTSTDAGVTFTTESTLPTGSPALDVLGLRVDFDLDNGSDTVYALMTVADPDGDLGLQVVRSDDFGVNWGAAVDLVRDGDDTHGVVDARISANSAGVVAVIYREGRGGDPYVRVSSDSGQTWSIRVRLNAAVADGGGTLAGPLWVKVDGSGIVHAAFVEDRGSNREVFYTRSTDGGATFEAERSFDAILPVGGRADSTNPVLQTTFDGSLLLAFWDQAGDDHVYVLRSTDSGQNFSTVLDRTFGNERSELFPMLFASRADGTTLVHVIDGVGDLTVQRSTDNGATYGTVRRLAMGTAAPHPLNIGLSGIGAASVTQTDSGTMAIAYTDSRADSYRGQLTDLFVQISTNNAQTWGSETRVDGTAAGTAGTAVDLLGVTGAGADDLVVVYSDNRGSAGSTFDVYSNRSAAASPSFASEQRIDADADSRDPNTFDSPSVAVGPSCGVDAGADNVYMAMAVRVGTEPEIRVAVSEDGGRTFATPVRISDTSGVEFAAVPRVVTTSGGGVHVAYTVMNSSTGEVELRYNKSDDCGQTWLPSEINFGLVVQSEFDLIALDSGEVYVFWSDSFDIRLRKSTDGGDTFGSVVFVNTNTSSFNDNPLACVVGSTVFVAFAAPDSVDGTGSGEWFTTYVTASGDGGATFEPEIQLMLDMGDGGSYQHSLDCYESSTGNAGVYAAVMANSFASSNFANVRWFEYDPVGGSLSALTRFLANPGADYGAGTAVRCLDTEPGPGSCLFLVDESVSEANGRTNRIALRKYDSAGVLGFERLLTDAAPAPTAWSQASRMTTDGLGNLWVSWLDASAGTTELVVRHSADEGQSFGSLYRLSRAEPQGSRNNSIFNFIKKGFSTAADGEAFFVWGAPRESRFFSGLFGVWDTDDFDRDGTPAGSDCDDSDPTLQSSPSELANVQVAKIGGGVRISWDAQGGTGTVYDIVSGPLNDLRGSGGFGLATCLVDDELNDFFDDLGADPPSGDGDYYLGRAENGCGPSTYGDSSSGTDPRDDLDSASPCP